MARDHQPPKLARRLFEWRIGNAQAEDLLGDLDELFYQNVEKKSLFIARINYWQHVFSLLNSYAISKRKKDAAFSIWSNSKHSNLMFINYSKVALRTLLKNKFFTLINILGLAIGMSISLLLLAVIADVTEYDDFHQKKDQIYRVITRTYDNNNVIQYASTPGPVGEKLKNLQGIENVVRISSSLNGDVNYNQKIIPLRGYYVDREFLEVFNFPLKSGSKSNVFNNPNHILLTESAAYKLFSGDDPMGKSISIPDQGDFIVGGVLYDHPKKSHLHFDMIASYQKRIQLEQQGALPDQSGKWDNWDYHYVYFEMTENRSVHDLDNELDRIGDQMQKANEDLEVSLEFESLNDLTFGKELNQSIGPQWDLISMIIFGLMALLILVPAALNYGNLSVARALQRAKEIGIRKVMGGRRNQIFYQFIVETMLVCLGAFFIAYIIFTFLRQEFLTILAPASSAGLLLEISPIMLLLFGVFVLMIGFLIGVIPAIHFSKLNSLQALKNKLPSKASGKINIRKALMVVQFVFSLGFIMSVAIMVEQYRYTANYKLGFDKENIVNIELQDLDPSQWKSAISKIPGVNQVGFASDVIGTQVQNSTWVGRPNGIDSSQVIQMYVDHEYLKIHRIPLVAGEGFPDISTHEESQVIVNQLFVKQFGFKSPDQAIDRTVILENGKEVKIIGVTGDFHYAQLRIPLQPFFFRNREDEFNLATVSISGNEKFELIDQLETTWDSLSEAEFKAGFLSVEIDELYQWYYHFVKMIGFLGLLSVSISCLGLLGMVVFNVENRTKEVGIRKVHGASTSKILVLLSRDYLNVIIIATAIAVPLTYWLFSTLLPYIQYYNTTIGFWSVLVSVVLIFAIAFLTVSSQTLKASRINPAETLRYE